MEKQLKQLHSLWCKLTGQSPEELRYIACERILYDYVQAGFTEDNLLHVLTFILHQNRKASEPRYRTKLQFRRIMEIETFASILAEAGPWYRNRLPRQTEKQKVVAAFRGVQPEAPANDSARTFRDVVEKAIKTL